MFWKGEDGYATDLRQVNRDTGEPLNKMVSAMDFYAYRIMIRPHHSQHIHMCRNLFNQYLTDMYAKIETERLSFLRHNQKKLRAEQYIHLKDAMVKDRSPEEIGQMIILPSTFTGSPRYMHEYTQDAMTYVRNYGRPDLFITLTCNSNWPEIQQNLFDGQPAHSRHDIIARVFHLKVKALWDLLTKGNIFGTTSCILYSIEWQKRGLPHVHLLLWLQEKIRPNQVDTVISAEIPDSTKDPKLFEIITKHMIHGPCGKINRFSVCMKDGKCTKNYPKQLLQETQSGEDGYPLYRRRKPECGGFTVKKTIQGRVIDLDNKWVVPYNPVLSRTFNAHINIEYCNSVKSIKYICKYIHKGSDQAVFCMQKENTQNTIPNDEIQTFQSGRYISSNEAVWRILGFPVHQRYPAVTHLSVHLENGQRVYFTQENMQERADEPPRTTLTGFFMLCQSDEFARTLLYHQIPKYYTWTDERIWKRRVVGTPVENSPVVKASATLGRVYTVHPSAST
jgi:hypothetical protein